MFFHKKFKIGFFVRHGAQSRAILTPKMGEFRL